MALHPELNESVDFDSTYRPGSRGILEIAWRRKALIALGLAVGLVVAGMYYARATPVFQSSAQVLVVNKRPDNLALAGAEGRAPALEDYLATHLVLIRSPLIVGRAVEKGKLRGLVTFAGQSDPTTTIIDALKVNREVTSTNATNILALAIRGPIGPDCTAVLHAVIDSYKEFLDVTYRNVSDDTVKLINKAAELLETKMNKLKDEHSKFRLAHPMLWRNKDGINPLQDRVFAIESKRSALLIRKTELEGRLSTLEKAVKAGSSRADLLAMIAAKPDETFLALAGKASAIPEGTLIALELEEAMLSKEYGPDHPQLRNIQARLALLRARSGQEEAAPAKGPQPRDPVEAHLTFLRQELTNTRVLDQALEGLLGTERAEARKLIGFELQDDAFTKAISHNKQIFDGTIKRLEEINLLRDFGGFETKAIAPPGPALKVGPRALPIFSIAAILGLLGGLALAYLAEVTDQTFRAPEEIRRRLGLPVIGHIPAFNALTAQAAGREVPGLAPTLCAVYHTKSSAAEAFRGVRTALYFSTRGESHRVIQITSPDQGDGKTTLAANLAVALAQSQKRVILIDADLRRPSVHKLFGLSAAEGLASVIGGQAEPEQVIQQTAVPGLSVLPCGPIPSNPAELLTLPRFKKLIEDIRTQYDCVIIDTPPLLVVTDPAVVTPLVDGVLLTIRLSKNARPHAERAKEVLTTLGAPILGVVVNGVDPKRSRTYGYDSYRYNYEAEGYNRDGAEATAAVVPAASPPANGHVNHPQGPGKSG
jgi:capsular exopolysaccharide synthesis family protein